MPFAYQPRWLMFTSDPLQRIENQYIADLQRIAGAIGYGRSQQILGELWDKELTAVYGIENPARGRICVTIDDKLPPVPKAANNRRQQKPNGGYCFVPAYTRAEMEAYAHQAIAKAIEDFARRDGSPLAYALVPVEPTKAMKIAGQLAEVGAPNRKAAWTRVWPAMIAAAKAQVPHES